MPVGRLQPHEPTASLHASVSHLSVSAAAAAFTLNHTDSQCRRWHLPWQEVEARSPRDADKVQLDVEIKNDRRSGWTRQQLQAGKDESKKCGRDWSASGAATLRAIYRRQEMRSRREINITHRY